MTVATGQIESGSHSRMLTDFYPRDAVNAGTIAIYSPVSVSVSMYGSHKSVFCQKG